MVIGLLAEGRYGAAGAANGHPSRFESARYAPSATIVAPDARLSRRARAARAARDASNRTDDSTATTSTSVLSVTQIAPSSTSCGTTGSDARTNCGRNARKNKAVLTLR